MVLKHFYVLVLLSLLQLQNEAALPKPLSATETDHVAPDPVAVVWDKKSLNLASNLARKIVFFFFKNVKISEKLIPVLVQSLKSSYLSSTSLGMDKTF